MASSCWGSCFPGASALGREELLAKEYGLGRRGPAGKAVREGWVSLTSHKSPKKEKRVYARLTADALYFYEAEPTPLTEQLTTPQKSEAPFEVVLLSHVASVLGRGLGSEHVRISAGSGSWWQFKPEDQETVDWAEAFMKRFEHFKTARRRSSVVTGSGQENLKLRLEARSRKRRFLNRLARFLPCGADDKDFNSLVGGSMPYRGNREGAGELVDHDSLAKVTDPDLMEAQGGHWSEAAVTYLQSCQSMPEELIDNFNFTVRKGVPDGLKRLIWPLAVGKPLDSKVADVDADAFYNKLLDRSFGGVFPAEFQDPVPTFCQGVQGIEDAPPLKEVVKHLWLLKPSGENALRRLLWVIQLTSSAVEFCPFLPNLMATLLAFFSEAETIFIVSQLLQYEEESVSADEARRYPRILQSLQQLHNLAKLLVREGRRSNNIPEVLTHLEKIGVKLEEMAALLLQDGLASKLPFRVLCRLVGAFLAEGTEVTLRFAIALLKSRSEALLSCGTAQEAKDIIKNLGQDLGDNADQVDMLVKVAYGLNINSHMMRASSLWAISYAAEKKDYQKHIFCRPRLFEPRGCCPDEIWEVIWGWVPATCRILDPCLIYEPVMNGTSLRTCFELCKKQKSAPMIFFIYSREGDVVGGYSPAIWVRTDGAGYLDLSRTARPAEDAFVFRRLHGSQIVDVYPWSGENQMLLQASEMHGLVFGGDGAALHISKDLQRATSSASASFNSPPLLEKDLPHRTLSGASEASSSKCSDSFEMVKFEIFALV